MCTEIQCGGVIKMNKNKFYRSNKKRLNQTVDHIHCPCTRYRMVCTCTNTRAINHIALHFYAQIHIASPAVRVEIKQISSRAVVVSK